MKLDLYQQSGAKKGTVKASDAIFNIPVNNELMRLAVVRQQANARQSNAHTKARWEVRGGGKKPWRQKGTGRARVGSSRNPLWRGGGVVFGPSNEKNYKKGMSKKVRRAALFSALSMQAQDGNVFALDAYKSDAPKTKAFTDMVKKLPVKRSLLVILPEKDDFLERSARNVPSIKTIAINNLNVFDALKYEKIMFLEPALKKAEELFLSANSVKASSASSSTKN